MTDYVIDVSFHHIQIPISLNTISNVVDMALTKIRSYGEKVYQESITHNLEDNQYADSKKPEE